SEAGFESRLVARSWNRFSNRIPGATEWSDETIQELGDFKITWIIKIDRKIDGETREVTVTLTQPMEGVAGAQSPEFGSIIGFGGHVGIYLGQGMYASSTTTEPLSGSPQI